MAVEQDDTLTAFGEGPERVGYKSPPRGPRWPKGVSGGHLHRRKKTVLTIDEILRHRWNTKLPSGGTIAEAAVSRLI